MINGKAGGGRRTGIKLVSRVGCCYCLELHCGLCICYMFSAGPSASVSISVSVSQRSSSSSSEAAKSARSLLPARYTAHTAYSLPYKMKCF